MGQLSLQHLKRRSQLLSLGSLGRTPNADAVLRYLTIGARLIAAFINVKTTFERIMSYPPYMDDIQCFEY